MRPKQVMKYIKLPSIRIRIENVAFVFISDIVFFSFIGLLMRTRQFDRNVIDADFVSHYVFSFINFFFVRVKKTFCWLITFHFLSRLVSKNL